MIVIAAVFVVGGSVLIGILCCKKKTSKTTRVQHIPVTVSSVGGPGNDMTENASIPQLSEDNEVGKPSTTTVEDRAMKAT